jgi:hypothetical protein
LHRKTSSKKLTSWWAHDVERSLSFDAVAEKLKREKLLLLTREVMKLPRDNEKAPGWETSEAVSKWVHDGRAEPSRIRKV